ncbi:head GIN domain-containing protein [Flavitalea flava]
MKRVSFFLLGIVALLPVLAQKTIINDPNVQLRNVKNFNGIQVSNAIDLYLSQGDQETVAVSAKDIEWRDRIRTEVQDGILKIWVDSKGWSWSGGNKKMKAYISFTMLNKLKASGSSNIYVDGVISGNSLDLTLSGASDFKGAVKVTDLHINQSGASDAQITGTVANLTTIQSSGASDVKAYDLATENCSAHASGASDIRITVNKELNAHASGASSIYYKGDGVIRDLHSSGASNVSKKS